MEFQVDSGVFPCTRYEPFFRGNLVHGRSRVRLEALPSGWLGVDLRTGVNEEPGFQRFKASELCQWKAWSLSHPSGHGGRSNRAKVEFGRHSQ